MRSRYCGPARPRTPYKDWLQGGYKATSWSRDQSRPPEIYLPPQAEVIYYYKYIDDQGYPFDLTTLDQSIDLQSYPNKTFYDLND